MKITTINYKKVFPIGAYQNEPLGIEATLDEGEDPIEAFKTLKQLAHEAHKAMNLQLYKEEGRYVPTSQEIYESTGIRHVYTHSPIEQYPTEPPPKKTKDQMLLEEIQKAKKITDLNQWKLLISNAKQEIKTEYEKKLLELSK